MSLPLSGSRVPIPAAAGVALLTALALAAPAPGQSDALREELAEVAKGVKQFLLGKDLASIAVGQFTAPPQLAASGGPLIAKVLMEELPKVGVTVDRKAAFSIEGRYHEAVDAVSGQVIVSLKAKLIDRQGEEVAAFSRAVHGETTVNAMFGLTVDQTATADKKERARRQEEAIENPKVHVRGTEVAASAASPYAVEVRVRKEGSPGPARPCPVTLDDGLAYVPLGQGEVYEVVLVNNSDHDAAVTLTIDGLNLFAFSDVKDAKGQPKYSHVIVGRKSRGLVKGWHRTNKDSEEFLVSSYARSAAKELNSTANVGTVTATFAAAWPRDVPPPPDEPRNPNQFSRSADTATARGSRVGANYTEVERDFGVVRATVSVRYNK